MRRFTWLAVALVLCAGPASARQFLLGVRAGGGAAGASDLGLGAVVAIDGTVQVHGLLLAELLFSQGLYFPDGRVATVSGGGVGMQYRIDIASIWPYVTLGIESFRSSRPSEAATFSYGFLFAAGVLVPIRESLFAGVEARYQASPIPGSDFPARQEFTLRFGWRFGEP